METKLLRAVAYRRTVLRMMWLVAICGMAMSAVLARAEQSWVIAAAALIATVDLYLLTLIDVAHRIERVTGLSRSEQALLLARCRLDTPFAARLDKALADYGFWNALDDMVRPAALHQRPLHTPPVQMRETDRARPAAPLAGIPVTSVRELLTQRSEHILRRM
jgi:hypothetical protein